ncbi:MAG: hypothetical protein ABI479_10735 [Gallionella sp.]
MKAGSASLFADAEPDLAPAKPGIVFQGLPFSVAGGGCFLGFFASLVLRCCPLAMIVLLVVIAGWNCGN